MPDHNAQTERLQPWKPMCCVLSKAEIQAASSYVRCMQMDIATMLAFASINNMIASAKRAGR